MLETPDAWPFSDRVERAIPSDICIINMSASSKAHLIFCAVLGSDCQWVHSAGKSPATKPS